MFVRDAAEREREPTSAGMQSRRFIIIMSSLDEVENDDDAGR